MVELVNLERFLELRKRLIIVDVRSPVEYDHAHIPDSVNIPLFSDDQRARIGWTYKHKGQEEAITLGESFAEPKIPSYLSQAENYAQGKEILVLCARALDGAV
jgi:tRNA 2-selenouridine synthase